MTKLFNSAIDLYIHAKISNQIWETIFKVGPFEFLESKDPRSHHDKMFLVKFIFQFLKVLNEKYYQ